jgi:hypothetical protein
MKAARFRPLRFKEVPLSKFKAGIAHGHFGRAIAQTKLHPTLYLGRRLSEASNGLGLGFHIAPKAGPSLAGNRQNADVLSLLTRLTTKWRNRVVGPRGHSGVLPRSVGALFRSKPTRITRSGSVSTRRDPGLRRPLGQIILPSMKRGGPSVHDLKASNFDSPKRTAGCAHKSKRGFIKNILFLLERACNG